MPAACGACRCRFLSPDASLATMRADRSQFVPGGRENGRSLEFCVTILFFYRLMRLTVAVDLISFWLWCVSAQPDLALP